MYKSALILFSLCAFNEMQASTEPITTIPPLKRQVQRKKLSQAEMDTLAKTLGMETAQLFASNATKSEQEKRDSEKGGHAPVTIELTPKQNSSPKNNYVAHKPQKKAHNTKTLGARCCGLSNEE